MQVSQNKTILKKLVNDTPGYCQSAYGKLRTFKISLPSQTLQLIVHVCQLRRKKVL
jgi:hypothetical protein